MTYQKMTDLEWFCERCIFLEGVIVKKFDEFNAEYEERVPVMIEILIKLTQERKDPEKALKQIISGLKKEYGQWTSTP